MLLTRVFVRQSRYVLFHRIDRDLGDSKRWCNLMSNGQIMNLYEFHQGQLPLMISFPHSGDWIPDELLPRMTPVGRTSVDTDWFLPRLYQIAELPEVSSIIARPSRYVIDLNRSPDGTSLYPGQDTTALCPQITFAKESIYADSEEPQTNEVEQRKTRYWQPYHQQLRLELERLVRIHGKVVLLDAHSIASRVPMLFDGVLSDFNMGTQRGATCEPSLSAQLEGFCDGLSEYSYADNDRFIGGYITRHYGQIPSVNSVQLELSQATYMNESNGSWQSDSAASVAKEIRRLIELLLDWSQH